MIDDQAETARPSSAPRRGHWEPAWSLEWARRANREGCQWPTTKSLVVPGEMLSPGGLRTLDKLRVPEVVVEHVARGILVSAPWSSGSPETRPVAAEPSRP